MTSEIASFTCNATLSKQTWNLPNRAGDSADKCFINVAKNLICFYIDYYITIIIIFGCCDIVCSLTSDYMLKRLHRVQNACASFVLGKFATVYDVISLRWLPVRERREFNLFKMVYKALHN